jgi:CHASE2 domain-containing sensor protein
VEVSYFPVSFPWALLLTALGAAAATGLALTRRKRPVQPKRSAIALLSLALLSVAVVGAYAAVIHHAWQENPAKSAH